jgi:hypothetical protein
MDHDEVAQIIQTTIDETIIATIEAVQSIINTYINTVEDGWQARDTEQKLVTKPTIELLVDTLTHINDTLGELSKTRTNRGLHNGPTNS